MTEEPSAQEPVVVAVTPADEDAGAPLDEVAVAAAVAEGGEEVREHLVALQAELAGTASTGVPAVDEALARLAELDPEDLSGSAAVLSDVLSRLETVLGEAPPQ